MHKGIVPYAKFYFVGKGEDPSVDKMLQDEATKLNIEKNVILIGYFPLNRALKYVRKATVCVSFHYPSFVLKSTSPTKVIEYMAMSKAVVGNDHPEQKIILTKSGGGICVAYDDNKFAEAVVKLLRNRGMAVAMGRKGGLYVQRKRTYPVIANMVERQYSRITRKRQ